VGKSSTGCIYGASVIGNRKISPHQQGQQAAQELVDINHEMVCVDSYAQDQVINFAIYRKNVV
jgi:RNA 3'-terminal phosphate cyclase